MHPQGSKNPYFTSEGNLPLAFSLSQEKASFWYKKVILSWKSEYTCSESSPLTENKSFLNKHLRRMDHLSTTLRPVSSYFNNTQI